MHVAEFACQGNRGSRQAELLLQREGEHLRVRICAAIGATRTAVQRDACLLIVDEVQKHWPEVVLVIRSRRWRLWVKHGCVSRKKHKRARNLIDVQCAIKVEV